MKKQVITLILVLLLITGCNKGNIGSCCKGKRKSAGGFIWKYKKI